MFKKRSPPPRPPSSASTSIPATSPPPRSPSTARCRSSAAPSPPLRPGILRDGEVADVPALAEALKALLRRARASEARAARDRQPADRRAHARPAAAGGREGARRRRQGRRRPTTSRCRWTRRCSTGSRSAPSRPPAGQARTRVVVVAVRREMVDRLVGAAREAGLTVEGIDLSAFGMVRALADRKAEGAVLYVSVAGLTNVAVANASGCLFTRAAAGGLDAMVHTLAERRGLTAEHARQWLQHVGLHAPLEERRRRRRARRRRARGARGGRPPARRHGAQLAELLPHAGERRARSSAASLTGPAVAIPGFVEALAEQLRLPLDAAPSVAGASAELGRLTVAAGLAVEERRRRRRAGDRIALERSVIDVASRRDRRRHRRDLRLVPQRGRLPAAAGRVAVAAAVALPAAASTPIKPYDNVPVLSWLAAARPLPRLRGADLRALPARRGRHGAAVRARACSPRGRRGRAARASSLVLLLVPVTLIDLDHRIIPNKLMVLGAVAGAGARRSSPSPTTSSST